LSVFVCCFGCEHRDYVAECPEGWQKIGSRCNAPLSYRGPCSATQDVTDDSEAAKRQLEAACFVQWPCRNACLPDYSSTCPLNWIDMGNGVCDAPAAYSNHCPKRVRMTDEIFKRSFANECAVHWPCRKSCEEDFGQPCPEDWVLSDGICEVGNRPYNGPCAPFANLNNLTIQDKMQYGALCQLQFPCQPKVLANSIADCVPSAAPCPEGWIRKGSRLGVCHGAQYKGPCRPVVTIADIAKVGKIKFMEMCGVTWECMQSENDAIDSSAIPGQTMHAGPVDIDGRIIGMLSGASMR